MSFTYPFSFTVFLHCCNIQLYTCILQGWETGTVGMKKGTKRILIVPPALGYGSKGAGSKIPPNSTLIFQITILRVSIIKYCFVPFIAKMCLDKNYIIEPCI